MYKAFLIDLDGTAYLGTKVIKQTVEFVQKCKENNIKVLFVTNNASATKEQVYTKLTNMGYDILQNEILTSAMAMATYYKLKEPNNIPYVIGDDGLIHSLKENNIKFYSNLDYELDNDVKVINTLSNVIVGYNNKATFKDLGVASLVLQKLNSTLYATNKDLVLPTNLGGLPGNGSYVGLLEQVNDKEAIEVGKPTNIILNQALKLLNLSKEDVCMIGDNYQTDIMFGIANNIDTIFVEGGVSTLQYVNEQQLQPTYKVKDLSFFDIKGSND